MMPLPPLLRRPSLFLLPAFILLMQSSAGCNSTIQIDDPIAELRDPESSRRRLTAAMEMTDADPTEPARLEALHRMIWVPRFVTPVRQEAFDRLAEIDLAALKLTIRRQLPRMTNWDWLTRLCENIAQRKWIDLTPALVSSWARPTNLYVETEEDRPEYKALVSLYSEDEIPDVIYDLLINTQEVHLQGLRTRCWTLLNRLGYRARLVELSREDDAPANDAMLRDLQRAARDLAIVPSNREEILWIRKLLEPEMAGFWTAATEAVALLPESTRANLELRDLAIIVAAAGQEPGLLQASEGELYQRVNEYVRSGERHIAGRNYQGFGNHRQQLHELRDEVTWGDLAAMLMAVRAMQVPEVAAHLFRYADRDKEDDSTEYGGIIVLDDKGRFEVLEFIPRVRNHDQRFNASQSMFDAGYNGVFHFHFHAQKFRNAEHAGPGYGDLQYANETRANCLVLTFINENTLNVDYYRYDALIVDLGEVHRR